MTGRLAAAASTVLLTTGTAGKPQLPSFLSAVQGPLDHYGLWAIGLLLLLENIGVPVVPGEFAMIAGAIYAGAGQLNVVAVGVVSVVASVLGATIGYCIGRLGGRALVLRYGKWLFIREHHLDRAERTVDRYGSVVVVAARYIVGLRELNGIIAGATGMHPVRFTVSNIIGAVAWVATWVTLGYVAGHHINAIYHYITQYSLYALIAVVVLLVAYIVMRALRRRRLSREWKAHEHEENLESPASAGINEQSEAIEQQHGTQEAVEAQDAAGIQGGGSAEAPASAEAAASAEAPASAEKVPASAEAQAGRGTVRSAELADSANRENDAEVQESAKTQSS